VPKAGHEIKNSLRYYAYHKIDTC